ncbi:MAG: GNAT family N-acetyltransferase [Acidobacteriota bacterium]|nr:GNAT family N-acetyltransferase [Acidobacteriota bacterium]
MSLPILRLAKPADVGILVRLMEQTFRDTYGEANTPENMDTYVGSAFNRNQITRELSDPAVTYLLAELEDEPAGYAKLHDREPPSCVTGPAPIELSRIYARTDLIGRGIGGILMRGCLDQAQGKGRKTMWLSVWQPNHRALEFYTKWSFRDVGTMTFVLGNDHQTDVVLARMV